MRVQITLYGDDAEWFINQQQKIAEKRGGSTPSNAEVVRLMLEQFDP